MQKIIFGVIAGFVVWSFLWVGSDELLARIFKDWYAADRSAYFEALQNGRPFLLDSGILLISLLRGTIFCLGAGFLSVFISEESKRAPLYLGFLLLAVGVFAHYSAISNLPVWYHILFLTMLVPATLLGGKLRKPF